MCIEAIWAYFSNYLLLLVTHFTVICKCWQENFAGKVCYVFIGFKFSDCCFSLHIYKINAELLF